MQILGPFLVFRFAFDGDRGGAAIAPVIEDDAIAGLGDLLAERAQRRSGAPAARLQADEWSALAEDLVVDLDAADLGDRHGFLPDRLQIVTQATATTAAPQTTMMAPVARLIRPPHGRVFSISTNSAMPAIQARFMMPPTNKSASSIQQQPRQHSRWLAPLTKAPGATLGSMIASIITAHIAKTTSP